MEVSGYRIMTHWGPGKTTTATAYVELGAVNTRLVLIAYVLHQNFAVLLSIAANPASFDIFQYNQRSLGRCHLDGLLMTEGCKLQTERVLRPRIYERQSTSAWRRPDSQRELANIKRHLDI